MSDNQENSEATGQDPDAPELPETFDYATSDDLPVKKKFATTRKTGYVEDEVDVWIDQTITTSTEFLNRYNETAYAYNYLMALYVQLEASIEGRIEAGVAEKVDEAVTAERVRVEQEMTTSFQEQYSALQNSFSETESNLHAHYQTQISEAENKANEAIHKMNVAVQEAQQQAVTATPAPEQAPETVAVNIEPITAPTSSDPVTQRLFNEAAITAQALVDETRARLMNIEDEAREQAEQATVEARQEAENYRKAAQVALDLRDKLIRERDEILASIRLFHASQMEAIDEEQSKVGYSPTLTPDSDLSDVSDNTSQSEEPAVAPEPETTPETAVEAGTEASTEASTGTEARETHPDTGNPSLEDEYLQAATEG